MKTALTFLAILYLGTANLAHAAQVSELEAIGHQPTVLSPQGVRRSLYTDSHALLISESKYKNALTSGWRPLPTTHSELDQLSELLQKHGFHVTRVKDPTGQELRNVLRGFAAKYGHTEDTRFLVMFSGHGYTNRKNQVGYLVPIDAPNPSSAPVEFYQNAIPIRELEIIARELESRHAIFLFDSCFSGSIFTPRSALQRQKPEDSSPSYRWRFLTDKAMSPVRQFIAAGGPDEELPGKSIFVPLLLKALDGTASISQDDYLSGRQLGLWLEQTVPTFNASQNPHSDVMNDPGYAWGDMIFQLDRESLWSRQQ